MTKTPNNIDKMTRKNVSKLDNGCWLWIGCTNADGYGTVGFHWKTCLAHRVFYEELKKPIQEGYELHHKCGNRRCVNPDHMEEHLPHKHPDSNEMKTHCKRGHEFTPENTAIHHRGARHCRICRRLIRAAKMLSNLPGNKTEKVKEN